MVYLSIRDSSHEGIPGVIENEHNSYTDQDRADDFR